MGGNPQPFNKILIALAYVTLVGLGVTLYLVFFLGMNSVLGASPPFLPFLSDEAPPLNNLRTTNN